MSITMKSQSLQWAVLVTLFCTAACTVPLMDDEMGQAMFHQGEQYMVFVNDFNNDDLAAFEEYCQNDKCALMNPEVELYPLFRKFMGVDLPNYYMILNVRSRAKYIFEGPATVEALADFRNQVNEGTWPKFYASEAVPKKQKYPYATKLVGTTVVDFVTEPGVNIVVFFFAKSEVCDQCPGMLKSFLEFAQKHASESLKFGFMDRLANQNPQIKQENVPAIIVYRADGERRIFEKDLDQWQQYVKNLDSSNPQAEPQDMEGL